MAERARRVLLKLSGEALAAERGAGLDSARLRTVAAEVGEASRARVRVAIVVGGGNFLRGRDLEQTPVAAHTAHYMGMLATVMNGMALADTLAGGGVAAELYSAIEVAGVVRRYQIAAVLEALDAGRVCVLAGGTGNPYFTTDTCAGLRAVELGVDLLLKGTKVEGIFSGDPKLDPDARLHPTITYGEILDRRLRVMDATAIALCREHEMPIRVFDMTQPGNVRRALLGEKLGSLVEPDGGAGRGD